MNILHTAVEVLLFVIIIIIIIIINSFFADVEIITVPLS